MGVGESEGTAEGRELFRIVASIARDLKPLIYNSITIDHRARIKGIMCDECDECVHRTRCVCKSRFYQVGLLHASKMTGPFSY